MKNANYIIICIYTYIYILLLICTTLNIAKNDVFLYNIYARVQLINSIPFCHTYHRKKLVTPYLSIVFMWYSVFNSSDIVSGAPDIKSRPSIVFGKAITFRMLFALQSKQTRRSNPIAIPP